MITPHQIEQFQKMIWHFYALHGRSFTWRNIDNPYHIMVSEIMLQQTQTHRVAQKYEEFIAAFADINTLAQADLRDVLGVWQGLGYNRRGRALWLNAQRLMHEYNGIIPDDTQELATFAHIGPNTAGSIIAFAYNKPTIFIETNIRTVYLHTFFKDQQEIHDKELMPLIAATVDQINPRQWYYALMDYGVHLKKMVPNPSRKSAHHTKQSKFEGSDRQIRGRIIKKLTEAGSIQEKDLFVHLGHEHERYALILQALLNEGMIKKDHELILF